MDKTKPLYQHDCGNCKYLVTTHKQDLYYCDQGGRGATIVRRFSSEPSDYGSGTHLSACSPETALGMLVAASKGYLTWGDIMEYGFDSKLPEGETLNLRQWAKPLDHNKFDVTIDEMRDIAQVVDTISDVCMFSEGEWEHDEIGDPRSLSKLHYQSALSSLHTAQSQFLLAAHWYEKENDNEI